jgi:hypothetical protein
LRFDYTDEAVPILPVTVIGVFYSPITLPTPIALPIPPETKLLFELTADEKVPILLDDEVIPLLEPPTLVEAA